jgi:hypothetical protein
MRRNGGHECPTDKKRLRLTEADMKVRDTNQGRRFLGLDFADWSLLLVGFALAGFLALSI